LVDRYDGTLVGAVAGGAAFTCIRLWLSEALERGQ
jgi:hypothetical protein